LRNGSFIPGSTAWLLARLLTFPNVLVTAHQAFLTHEALSEIARITVENVWRFVSKQDLLEGTVFSNTSSCI